MFDHLTTCDPLAFTSQYMTILCKQNSELHVMYSFRILYVHWVSVHCVSVYCVSVHCVSVYYQDCSVSQSCPTTPCDYTTPHPPAFCLFLGSPQ